MIATNESYDAYSDIRKVEFGITFGITSVDADKVSVMTTEEFPASQTEQIIDGNFENEADYTTLEHNMWLLNGKKRLYPAKLDSLQTGFISQSVSDDDKLFLDADAKPQFCFEFAVPQDSYGITIIFDTKVPYSWATNITANFYDANGNLLNETTAKTTGTKCWMDAAVKNYTRLEIKFNETALPHRRVRVTEIIFGMIATYDKHDVESATEIQEMDILTEQLPSSQLTITIDNSDGLYDLLNPKGVYEFLQNGQYAEYWYGINDIKVQRGKKYFTKAESNGNGLTATITFSDEVMFLENIQYNGGMSGTWTLEEAVNTLVTALVIKIDACFENDNLKGRIIRKCIPQETTLRDAIAMCAQAAMCNVWIDNQNRLYFADPTKEKKLSELLTRERLSEEPVTNIGERYNTVTAKRTDSYSEDAEEESYTASAAESYEAVIAKEISNPLINDLQEWAEWALQVVRRHTTITADYRGDPTLQLGDVIKVYDKFAVNKDAHIESHELRYDGGLTGKVVTRV